MHVWLVGEHNQTASELIRVQLGRNAFRTFVENLGRYFGSSFAALTDAGRLWVGAKDACQYSDRSITSHTADGLRPTPRERSSTNLPELVSRRRGTNLQELQGTRQDNTRLTGLLI